jgi:hypothetical protein
MQVKKDMRSRPFIRLQGFVDSIKYDNFGKQPATGSLGTCSKYIYAYITDLLLLLNQGTQRVCR